MYEIIYNKFAKKQLKKLNLDVSKRILKTLERIRIRPHHFIKSLAGSKYYSLRTRDYRITLDIQNNKLIIFVVEIGPRKNIYSSNIK